MAGSGIFRISRCRMAMSLLLKVSEIPGAVWKMRAERTWKIGSRCFDEDNEVCLRARDTGSIVARRFFDMHKPVMAL